MVSNAGGLDVPTVSVTIFAGWRLLGHKNACRGAIVVFAKTEKNTVFGQNMDFWNIGTFFGWRQHDVIRWGQGRVTSAWRYQVRWQAVSGPWGCIAGGHVGALAGGGTDAAVRWPDMGMMQRWCGRSGSSSKPETGNGVSRTAIDMVVDLSEGNLRDYGGDA